MFARLRGIAILATLGPLMCLLTMRFWLGLVGLGYVIGLGWVVWWVQT